MKKRLLTMMFSVIMLMTAVTGIVLADNDSISVYLDGEYIQFDVPPQIINDRTMVPLRAIFEALNASVDWNGETKTITSLKEGTSISLTIDRPEMYVNETKVMLDSPACIINERTLVPVRAISQSFNATVDWDSTSKTVYITTPTNVVKKTLSTQEFNAGMAKGIAYFNSGLFYEARDEFQWFCDNNWGKMNSGQQQYALDYLDGTKAKISQLNQQASSSHQSSSQSTSNSNKNGVYRTPSGKRYHFDPDCGGKNSYAITLEAAKGAGLTPCAKCAR